MIIINLKDLKSLNIDEYFIAIFLASSLTYWTYYRWPSGWLALLVSLSIYILYKKLGYRLLSTEPAANKILMIIAVVFLLGLLMVWNSLNIPNVLSIAHLTIVRIPFLLVEEVIFRGMLWQLLANINWSPLKITLFQALLFWLSHAYDMLVSPVLFWIVIPIASILLGVLVWRSKSLTISFLAHVSFNFLSAYF